LEILVFKERGKPKYPEKNLLEQSREPTTNSTHIRHQVQESNLGHKSLLSALTTTPSLFSPLQQDGMLVHHRATPSTKFASTH